MARHSITALGNESTSDESEEYSEEDDDGPGQDIFSWVNEKIKSEDEESDEEIAPNWHLSHHSGLAARPTLQRFKTWRRGPSHSSFGAEHEEDEDMQAEERESMEAAEAAQRAEGDRFWGVDRRESERLRAEADMAREDAASRAMCEREKAEEEKRQTDDARRKQEAAAAALRQRAEEKERATYFQAFYSDCPTEYIIDYSWSSNRRRTTPSAAAAAATSPASLRFSHRQRNDGFAPPPPPPLVQRSLLGPSASVQTIQTAGSRPLRQVIIHAAPTYTVCRAAASAASSHRSPDRSLGNSCGADYSASRGERRRRSSAARLKPLPNGSPKSPASRCATLGNGKGPARAAAARGEETLLPLPPPPLDQAATFALRFARYCERQDRAAELQARASVLDSAAGPRANPLTSEGEAAANGPPPPRVFAVDPAAEDAVLARVFRVLDRDMCGGVQWDVFVHRITSDARVRYLLSRAVLWGLVKTRKWSLLRSLLFGEESCSVRDGSGALGGGGGSSSSSSSSSLGAVDKKVERSSSVVSGDEMPPLKPSNGLTLQRLVAANRSLFEERRVPAWCIRSRGSKPGTGTFAKRSGRENAKEASGDSEKAGAAAAAVAVQRAQEEAKDGGRSSIDGVPSSEGAKCAADKGHVPQEVEVLCLQAARWYRAWILRADAATDTYDVSYVSAFAAALPPPPPLQLEQQSTATLPTQPIPGKPFVPTSDGDVENVQAQPGSSEERTLTESSRKGLVRPRATPPPECTEGACHGWHACFAGSAGYSSASALFSAAVAAASKHAAPPATSAGSNSMGGRAQLTPASSRETVSVASLLEALKADGPQEELAVVRKLAKSGRLEAMLQGLPSSLLEGDGCAAACQGSGSCRSGGAAGQEAGESGAGLSREQFEEFVAAVEQYFSIGNPKEA